MHIFIINNYSYYAFGMEMTNNFNERDQLWFWNQLSGNLGTLVGMALPAVLVAVVTGNLYTVFMLTGFVFVGVHASGMLGNVTLIAEKPLHSLVEGDKELEDEERKSVESVLEAGDSKITQSALDNANAKPFPAPFVVNLLRCLRNEPFDHIIRSYLLDYLGLGMISAMTPYVR
jgi:Na+/melibiose symporter-like transporter